MPVETKRRMGTKSKDYALSERTYYAGDLLEEFKTALTRYVPDEAKELLDQSMSPRASSGKNVCLEIGIAKGGVNFEIKYISGESLQTLDVSVAGARSSVGKNSLREEVHLMSEQKNGGFSKGFIEYKDKDGHVWTNSSSAINGINKVLNGLKGPSWMNKPKITYCRVAN
ncbi:MAG: hypothetical protein HY424_03540 [Candidatus Levybacteria bacterium]|nr:hypothetical protein [Candidatus Levybacteria bacterium]